MQIFALDKKNLSIPASQAKRGVDYVCPECFLPLRVKRGFFIRPHFFHKGEGKTCFLNLKTLTHLEIQNYFLKHGAVLEKRFDLIGRIADVVLEEEKLIFEIQVSPISSIEVKERIRDYRSVGYEVVWILHDRTFNRNRRSEAEIELSSSTHYFTNMNDKGTGGFYDQIALYSDRYKIKTEVKKEIFFDKIRLNETEGFRKNWKVSFEGDLLHYTIGSSNSKKSRFKLYKKWLWHYFLIKSCS